MTATIEPAATTATGTPAETATTPAAPTRYLYYPGCSMEGSGRAYRESLDAIAGPLGLELVEVEDWNCCGATEMLGIALTPAYTLVARNLALAAKNDRRDSNKLVAACSACYLNLAKTDKYMRDDSHLAATINDALGAGGLAYQPGALKVRHLLDVIMTDIGLPAVEAKVTKPLTGLKVAPYLGCMLPRPDPDGRFKKHQRTDELDQLLRSLGAEVVDFPLKTECCGGHMLQIVPRTGLEMIKRLIEEAQRHGADAMVTVCPMCQINIDAYQAEMNAKFHVKTKMPILFFTQLMGLAFGVDQKKLGIGRELTSAKRALAHVGAPQPAPEGAEAAGPARAHRPKPDKRALPMPQMSDETSQEVAE